MPNQEVLAKVSGALGAVLGRGPRAVELTTYLSRAEAAWVRFVREQLVRHKAKVSMEAQPEIDDDD